MTKPIPEGYTALTPSLSLENAQEAINLYTKAFGAKELGTMRSSDGSGKIMHSVLEIGGARFFIADNVMCGSNSKPTNSAFYLYVTDVDSMYKQARSAGLTELMPVTDMFWGDRTGTVVDKFGISWTIATHTREVSGEEMEKAAIEFEKNLKGKAA